MSDSAPTVAPPTEKKKSSRIKEFLIVMVVIGVVVGAAFYQEPISAFFRLHLWDRNAPAHVVEEFLQAGKRGDKKTADRYLGATSYQSVTRNGKWLGYSMTAMPGTMEFLFEDLAPKNPKATSTEFVTVGNGAAKVMVPNAKGEAIGYRLEMRADGWKVVDILGGRPVKR